MRAAVREASIEEATGLLRSIVRHASRHDCWHADLLRISSRLRELRHESASDGSALYSERVRLQIQDVLDEMCWQLHAGEITDEMAADMWAQACAGDFVLGPHFMVHQVDVNGRMRAVLIDWLIDVHRHFYVRSQTLFLAQSIVDRCLALTKQWGRTRLQLLGVTALFIAAKFEEGRPPTKAQLSYFTGYNCLEHQILHMEVKVLTALDFQIDAPTSVQFLDHLHHDNFCDSPHRSFAQYVLELSLLDLRSLLYKPSMLAAASVLLSQAVLGQQQASPAVLAQHGGHDPQSLKACAEDLNALVADARANSFGGVPLNAVARKFSTEAMRELPERLWS